MNHSEHYLKIWKSGTGYVNRDFSKMKPEDFTKKIPGIETSAGFLLQHIAETKLFILNAFFKHKYVFEPKTFFVQDNGSFTHRENILAFWQTAEDELRKGIETLPAEDWETPLESPVGKMTPAQALSFLVWHTGHHAGQLAWLFKYGQ